MVLIMLQISTFSVDWGLIIFVYLQAVLIVAISAARYQHSGTGKKPKLVSSNAVTAPTLMPRFRYIPGI